MKKLIFLLVLIPFLSFGQTDNYAFISSNSTWMNADDSKAFVYEIVADTVMSTDTLFITIPGKFGARYKATFIGDVTDYSTDDAGANVYISILGAACASCEYTILFSLFGFEIGDDLFYSNTPVEIIELPYIKLHAQTTCDQCILNGHIVLKPLK